MEERENLRYNHENNIGTKIPLKRNKKEIDSLAYSLKKNIKSNDELHNRAYYFFSPDDILDNIIFNLSKYIPKNQHILDKTEDFDKCQSSNNFSYITSSNTDSWNDPTIFDDISFDEEGKKEIIKKQKNEQKNDQQNDQKNDQQNDQQNEQKYTNKIDIYFPINSHNKHINTCCVEWLGYVNEANGYAAIKMVGAFISQEYYTYVNRLVYFLFMKTNYYGIENFLSHHNFVNKDVPLYMKCKNKLCIKLSHINVSNDLYL
ncbi:hypothetical protein PRSY57_1029700 [Plasmodium reichenowi]|uniref:Uncharacterized protein n=1 Tax=Plasmodium reichenowi TaxID=5854 RepID=A0A151LFX3_PLARE|nr:hypothetical protein PRSY57_1029700 [Plasmodium reichenowi]KYN97759.1 hypothetical protein PRSY57_1029700 [Plasmodium reichenowi]